MNWNNLLKNRCPKCKKELWFDKDEEMLICTITCGFMIHKDKMAKICVEIQGKKLSTVTNIYDLQ